MSESNNPQADMSNLITSRLSTGAWDAARKIAMKNPYDTARIGQFIELVPPPTKAGETRMSLVAGELTAVDIAGVLEWQPTGRDWRDALTDRPPKLAGQRGR